jgi:DNA-binding GntR family transcriptional regulator
MEHYSSILIRSLVEKRAITRTARTIQPAQLDELQALVQSMYAAARMDDLLTLSSLDMEFHHHICTCRPALFTAAISRSYPITSQLFKMDILICQQDRDWG